MNFTPKNEEKMPEKLVDRLIKIVGQENVLQGDKWG